MSPVDRPKSWRIALKAVAFLRMVLATGAGLGIALAFWHGPRTLILAAIFLALACAISVLEVEIDQTRREITRLRARRILEGDPK